MNAVQMAQQIKHLLEQARWPAGSQDLVFGAHGAVAVVAGNPTEDQIPRALQFCVIGIDSGEVDRDEPGLITQQITVTAAAEVAGDTTGENAVIGGALLDLGRSAGRGVSEVAAQVRATIQNLTGADGARIQLASVNTGSPKSMSDTLRQIALEEVIVRAVCTSTPHYAEPQRLRWAPWTHWIWEGSHCAARFDFLQYRLVRKRGRAPSVSPADGTTLYTGTAATWAGVQESGYTYTVFADYNSRGGTADEGSSSPAVGSWKVV